MGVVETTGEFAADPDEGLLETANLRPRTTGLPFAYTEDLLERLRPV